MGAVAVGGGLTIAPGALLLLGGDMASTPAIAAIGLVGGPLLMGAAALAAQKYLDVAADSATKAQVKRTRTPVQDFGQDAYNKMRNS